MFASGCLCFLMENCEGCADEQRQKRGDLPSAPCLLNVLNAPWKLLNKVTKQRIVNAISGARRSRIDVVEEMIPTVTRADVEHPSIITVDMKNGFNFMRWAEMFDPTEIFSKFQATFYGYEDTIYSTRPSMSNNHDEGHIESSSGIYRQSRSLQHLIWWSAASRDARRIAPLICGWCCRDASYIQSGKFRVQYEWWPIIRWMAEHGFFLVQ